MGNLIFDGKGIIGHDLIVKMKRGIEMLLQGFPPITANGTAKESITALTVYGHSTQDGTPSPENPVPIVSAGSVMVKSKNLADLREISASTNYNMTYSYDGYTATLSFEVTEDLISNGGTTGTGEVYISCFETLGDDLTGKTVTISYDSAELAFDSEYVIGIIYVDSEGITQFRHLLSSVESKSLTVAIPEGATNIRLRIFLIEKNSSVEILTPGTYTAKISGIMVALGDQKLPWEPWHVPYADPDKGEINVTVSDGGTQSQILILSTPGGLPGIPVASGGNYTDENGQQWVCDEIDLARGKYVQRVGSYLIDT